MAKIDVLVEIIAEQDAGFATFEAAAAAPPAERVAYAERLGASLAGVGLEFTDDEPAIPMFSSDVVRGTGARALGFRAFSGPAESPDVPASSTVMPARVDEERLEDLAARPTVRIWPNSRLTLLEAAVDCRPFQPAVSIAAVRAALGLDEMLIAGGGRGTGIGVGIL